MPAPSFPRFEIGETQFTLDGQPFVIRCGELHYTRVPPEEWKHRLQMCRAMGLNTVCVYGFWNFHEWQEGEFDWQGQADVAEFCRLAQAEGLWVILRPGPYSCAEWEMGGLPWWLLQREGIGLRTMDPLFLEPATRYLREVGRILAPLQITRGGPILLVQVENEYGSFGSDAEYMGAIRDSLADAGFEVPFFACNPPGDLNKGVREDIFQVVNFGPGGAGSALETLRKFQPTGPLMNGEYYPAWFDTWGSPHHTGDAAPYLRDLEWMLERGVSFSIYMAHGGTSFGLWSGADRPFRPDTSSYDYDAPISEAGHATDKFWRTRELFSRFLLPSETLPEPPAPNPLIAIESFKLHEISPIFDSLPHRIAGASPQIASPQIASPEVASPEVASPKVASPRTMESYGQSRGCIVYRTILPPGPAATLSVGAVHDFGWAFLGGEPIGEMNRRAKRYRLALPARSAPACLDILVEAMGRVNFGPGVFDLKGLHAPVTLIGGDDATELRDWQVFSLPLDVAQLENLKFAPVGDFAAKSVPAFWRGSFAIPSRGDTFLDVRGWGKGVLWVNGHCLGRFWNIGPTQTMFCPGAWLRAGDEGLNDITVLDLIGPQNPEIAGLTAPILSELRLDLDFSRPARAAGMPRLDDSLRAAGRFEPDVRWQEVRFEIAARGRYLCLESLGAHDGGPCAAVAELDVLDEVGHSVSKANWSVIWTSSEEFITEDGVAENAIDGQSASCWHTRRAQGDEAAPPHPHQLILDLGRVVPLGAIRYLPRAGGPKTSGRIADFRVYVSEEPFGLAV